jgi:hypothetical protein
MKLTKELIRDFRSIVEHYLDTGDLNPEDPKDFYRHSSLTTALSILKDVPARVDIVLEEREKVPTSNDLILNAAIDTVLRAHNNEEDPTGLESAIWAYLLVQYEFIYEHHDLYACTSEEAFTYAIKHLQLDV